MDSSAIGKLVAAFVTLIIAVVLIGQVSTVGNGVTELTPSSTTLNYAQAYNATLNLNPAVEFYLSIVNDSKTGWRASTDGCGLTSVVNSMRVGNTTETWNTGNYSISATNGSIRYFNTLTVNATGNPSNVSVVTYLQCPDGYVSGWAATILKLTYGIFALAALGVAIALFYSIAKDYGIV